MLPIERILCPTDFSASAAGAVEEAVALAREFGAQLQLLHVTPDVVALVGSSPFLQPGMVGQAQYETEMRAIADQQLDELLTQKMAEKVNAQKIVECGDAASVIARVAQREKTDLIVLATHGWTGWRNRIFGSVAEKVLRIAPCSVLVSRMQTPGAINLKLPLRTILCATDWSEPSLQSLDVAAQWAKHFGAELCVLHVIKPLESPGLLVSIEQIEASIRVEAAERLHKAVSERLPNGTNIETRVRVGSAADVIAEVADEESADLLVLATHGASGWRAAVAGTPVADLLFGSVTNNVLQLTSRPVLTVRMRNEE